jgi:hypothetical protein
VLLVMPQAACDLSGGGSLVGHALIAQGYLFPFAAIRLIVLHVEAPLGIAVVDCCTFDDLADDDEHVHAIVRALWLRRLKP